MSKVIDDVVALARPQRHFRDVAIETNVAPGLRAAMPAPRLTQVLLNLVLNAGAALATPPRSGGSVRLRAAAIDGRRLRIDVEDDGPGVAKQLRGRLFEPFVTTKEVGQGTGLGLAVCRGLVESAGGEIELDPTFEGGARFYVVLPAASP